jgi:hypothetical protein
MLNVDCVGKFFGVVTISKLSTIPFDKDTSTNALDALLGFEDSGESIVKKKTKFKTLLEVSMVPSPCANKQLNKLLLFQATIHKCCSRKFVRKKLDLTNMIGLLQTIKTHTC